TDSISIFEFAWAHKDPKDRKLNHADAVKFAKLDANDDSAVSRKEFGAGEFAQQARANDNQDAVGEAFDKIDDDGDGEISPREYAAALQRRRMAEADKGKDKPKKDEDGIDPRIVESFRELDRDDDRAVSLREFSRGELADRVDDRDVVEEIFERADANDDDELSLKEYAEFRKHFRGPPPGKKGKGKGKGKGGKR
ncbi:MAG: Ca2+-binding EF-hand superfamily protein, partial [Verrucomicrobiales bacterium]